MTETGEVIISRLHQNRHFHQKNNEIGHLGWFFFSFFHFTDLKKKNKQKTPDNDWLWASKESLAKRLKMQPAGLDQESKRHPYLESSPFCLGFHEEGTQCPFLIPLTHTGTDTCAPPVSGRQSQWSRPSTRPYAYYASILAPSRSQSSWDINLENMKRTKLKGI